MVYVNMNWILLVLGLITEFITAGKARTLDEQLELLSRDKRYLTYTYGSAIGMFLAFAVPLELPERDVLFSYNFEANYNLPTNLSYYDLSPPDRSFFSYINRTYVYDVLRSRLNNFGLNGDTCLLRTICEASRYPLFHNGVVGQILHILLTPSTSEDEYQKSEQEAEERGRSTTNDCSEYYNCPIDFLNFISNFED